MLIQQQLHLNIQRAQVLRQVYMSILFLQLPVQQAQQVLHE